MVAFHSRDLTSDLVACFDITDVIGLLSSIAEGDCDYWRRLHRDGHLVGRAHDRGQTDSASYSRDFTREGVVMIYKVR